MTAPSSPDRGASSVADCGKLVAWWNTLEQLIAEQQRREADRQATVDSTYQHGRSGIVVPEIGGAVKPRPETDARTS